MTTDVTTTPEYLTPSAEQIAKSIQALGHSVDIINSVIEAGNKTDEDVQRITANYQHLEIMLAKDYIKPTKASLTNINAAITAAKSFLA